MTAIECGAPSDLQTSEDALLGGRVVFRQPVTGYRAAVDSVLLGASVAERPVTGAILELGCGVGAALLVAGVHNPAAELVGVEVQAPMAELARVNLDRCGWTDRSRIVTGDVRELAGDPAWRDRFDAVMLNPPFFEDGRSIRPPANPERARAFVCQVGLEVWLDAALLAVRPRGHVVIIHRAERLGDVLVGLGGRAGDVRVRGVAPRSDAAARRVLVRARKGGKTPLTLGPALVLHDGERAASGEAQTVLSGDGVVRFPGPRTRACA